MTEDLDLLESWVERHAQKLAQQIEGIPDWARLALIRVALREAMLYYARHQATDGAPKTTELAP